MNIINRDDMWMIKNYYRLEMIGTRIVKTYIGFHP